ncbi:hypothetical protein [Bradyrhizobium sp. RT9a]|uniref:hypothetical protein n=1 Tax=Bradyrhizobium sp. RT9a TaxID=3156384 RepID=UPI003397F241
MPFHSKPQRLWDALRLSAGDIRAQVARVLRDLGDPEPPLDLGSVIGQLNLDFKYDSSADLSLFDEFATLDPHCQAIIEADANYGAGHGRTDAREWLRAKECGGMQRRVGRAGHLAPYFMPGVTDEPVEIAGHDRAAAKPINGMTRHEDFVPGIIDEYDEALIGDGQRARRHDRMKASSGPMS